MNVRDGEADLTNSEQVGMAMRERSGVREQQQSRGS